MSSIRLDNNYHGCNVQFSPILPRFLACSASQHYGLKGPGALFLLEVTTLSNLSIRQSFFWPDGLFDVAWSPLQENLVVTASGDESIQIWKLFENSAGGKNPIMCFKEHVMDVTSVDWNSNGIASGSWDGALKMWNVECVSSIATFAVNEQIHSVKWAPLLARTVAIATQNGLVLWDENVNYSINRIQILGTEFLDCDWSKHNSYQVATGGSDGKINTWDIRNLKNSLITLNGHHRAVRRLQWYPHGFNVIASVSYDLSTIIWDVNSQSAMETIQHHSGFVYGLDFNKNVIGEMVDCGWDSLIHVYMPMALNVNSHFLPKNKL